MSPNGPTAGEVPSNSRGAVHRDGVSVGPDELENTVRGLAQVLRNIGLSLGDAVVVSGVDQWGTLLLTLGARRAGVSVLPLPPLIEVTRLAAVVGGLRPRLVCTGEPPATDIRAKAAEFDCDVVAIDELLSRTEAPDAGEEVELPTVAGWMLTSARRRAPSSSTVTHAAAAAAQAWMFRLRFDLPESGRHLAATPFWHVDPVTVALGALHAGHDVVLAADTEAKELWSECHRLRATSVFVIPGVLSQAVSKAEGDCRPPALSSVISGIRPCPPDLRRAAEEVLGPVLYETYNLGDRHCLVTPPPSEIHERVGIWSLAAAQGDEIAVVEHDGRSVTRSEVVASARLLANALVEQGLAPGSVVASALSNSAAAVTAYLGSVLGGFGYLPMGVDLPLPRLRELCDLHGPHFLLTDEGGPTVRGTPGATVTSLVTKGSSTPDCVPSDGGFMLALSSGSTGLPKAVRRRSAPMDATMRAIVDSSLSRWLGMPTSGPHLVTGPLSGGAFWSTASSALHSGQTLVMMRSWSAGHALELVERHRVTSTFVLPSMMAAMLRCRAESPPRDLSSLQSLVHGAAPCSVELKQRMLDWLGPIVQEFYATTEAGGTYVLAPDWMRRPGTVGRPFPGISVRILDDNGIPLLPNHVGQVALSSGGFSHHGADVPDVHDGYVTPGDIGYLDDDGYLFLLGRESEILKVGGTKVHAREVEEVLCRHPAVLDAAVIGVPHPTLGECVVACVVTGAGHEDPDGVARSILRMTRQALPVVKSPRRLHLVDELPRTSNGKVDRMTLGARFGAVGTI